MAVVERINNDESNRESAADYDCVTDAVPPLHESRVDRIALRYVHTQADNVRDRLLEVEYLESLGIHIVDNSLQGDRNRLEVLSELEPVAHFRWSRLYDIRRHNRLTAAITKALKQHHDQYKASKLMH